ncbi:hypothetical protein BH10CHL1_BH10CHL1_48790 [soil metagenome]
MSISLEQITKRYEGPIVINNISFEVADGEFFVLRGAEGSGKTTILHIIAGLVEADQGRVLLDQQDVTQLPAKARKVGYVLQQPTASDDITVADSLEADLHLSALSVTEQQQRLHELLELVGLTGLGNRLPSQIAGGRQRVALARALVHQPTLLLLDEPFAALDAKLRSELQRRLKVLQRTLGITTLLATHDEAEAFGLADQLGVINAGRLIEVGPPQTLYQSPQTEFVATFLGTANLMVGLATRDSVHIGPHHFPLQDAPSPLALDNARRVQVLFRPENVVLAASEQALNCPTFGEGKVEQTIFGGSFEQLQIRLPPIPGVRPIAPPVAYGGNTFTIEALRTQDQASRLPLQPGQKVWVGINRVHALTHPGLRFLLFTDGSPAAQAALIVACEIARRGQARVTLLGCELSDEALLQHVEAVQQQIGGELLGLVTRTSAEGPVETLAHELQRQAYDLVVLPGLPHRERLAEQILQFGEHHLLYIPTAQPVPSRALICVAGGEPGKDDILFTGRLTRHLDATATLLSVLPATENTAESHEWLRRFLAGGVQTLDLLGVPAQATIRVGQARTEILQELENGGYDLLALGAPLPDRTGKIVLNGLVSELLGIVNTRPILIIRSSM